MCWFITLITIKRPEVQRNSVTQDNRRNSAKLRLEVTFLIFNFSYNVCVCVCACLCVCTPTKSCVMRSGSLLPLRGFWASNSYQACAASAFTCQAISLFFGGGHSISLRLPYSRYSPCLPYSLAILLLQPPQEMGLKHAPPPTSEAAFSDSLASRGLTKLPILSTDTEYSSLGFPSPLPIIEWRASFKFLL